MTVILSTIDFIIDMMNTSINGLLDFIEIQLAYFMLKQIPGNLRHICDLTTIRSYLFEHIRYCAFTNFLGSESPTHSRVAKLVYRIRDIFYRLYFGIWNHRFNVIAAWITFTTNMISNFSTYLLSPIRFILKQINWVSAVILSKLEL